MRRLPIHEVKPGMALARGLVTERGDLLLNAGVSLTAKYLEVLRSRGYGALYVRDSIDDDVLPPEVISDAVWIRVHQEIQSIYTIVFQIAGSVSHLPPDMRLHAVKNEPLPRAWQASSTFQGLLKQLDAFIREAPTVPPLVDISIHRTHNSCGFCNATEMMVLATMLGRRLGFRSESLRQLATGCLFHDIGTLLLPQEVISKPGKLDEHEWAVVQQHPILGYELLQRSGLNEIDLLPKHIALQHHERQDGNGYPRGLSGSNDVYLRSSLVPGQIMPIAHISAVVDKYLALHADRPHRRALPPEEIDAILRGLSGTELNGTIVDAFLSMVPMYPVATEVEVRGGIYDGFWGVVTETPLDAPARPRVRLVADHAGQIISPVYLDLREAVESRLVPTGHHR